MPGRTSSGAGNLGPDTSIPDKLFFKIGEVSLLVGVQPHVLRYWEKEVSSIRPGKTASNQRRYRRKDVEVFREIRRLLYEEKFTLAGARKRLMSPQQKGVEESVKAEVVQRPPAVSTPAPAPLAVRQAPPTASQLRLDFVDDRARVHIENAKAGLRELIAMCGE
ncbi:MAG: MerR family transcriptional regulator [Deltaproteobacteria bacterium]|jgi:DNA-binding transcriptional MerR regulator|nr:MerR family transcriptional regulator [Deltaproteobacteria bacterium]MBT6433392.1 MerR family transcriptional regulator [Deltaproteobacteria bacterium]MBT6491397.1 MerR family transcriptional regulator [Deltaproteobacteria bacterium]